MTYFTRSVALLAALARLAWATVTGVLVLQSSACMAGPAHGGGRATSPALFGSGLSKVARSAEIARLEKQMLERVNRDRAEHDLPPLIWDPALADVARHHSADMRDHHFFEHESPYTGMLEDRLDRAGYLFLTARENLSEAPNVEASQEGLLASPHHFENLMATDVTHVGIGIVHGGPVDPHNLSVTQVFATPSPKQSPAQVKQAIEKTLRKERAQLGLPKARLDAKLSELALHNIERLEAAANSANTKELNERLAPAARGASLSALLVSVQVVASAEVWVVPSLLLQEPRVAFGIAVREVKAERGRPALQVLLLAGPQR